MNKADLLDYEVAGSWWAQWLSSEWLQTLAAKYFAATVKRKHRRWQEHEQWKRQIAWLARAKPRN